jgi:hypothetical protein
MELHIDIDKYDLYKKTISDILARPCYVQWGGRGGSVAIMTQEAVHIYTTVFR